MKKSLILIAIALMVLVPVFADEPTIRQRTSDSKDSVDTLVETTLDLQPDYDYGITKDKYTDPTQKIAGSDIGTIKLTRPTSGDTDVLESATAYLSYRFYENDAVTLYVTVSGDMLPVDEDGNTDTTRSTNTKNKISWTLTINETEDSYIDSVFGDTKPAKQKTTPISITSDDDTLTEPIITYAKSNTIGDTRYNSAVLTVSQKANTSLKGVELGRYLATITLTAKSK